MLDNSISISSVAVQCEKYYNCHYFMNNEIFVDKLFPKYFLQYNVGLYIKLSNVYAAEPVFTKVLSHSLGLNVTYKSLKPKLRLNPFHKYQGPYSLKFLF